MEETFEIKTSGVDVEEIMKEIRGRIEEKRRSGFYDAYRIPASVATLEIDKGAKNEEFLDYYLKSIWRSADIDLGDFLICSKTFLLGRPIVWLKKFIWKLLRFYTFRLFSQQKIYNARMVNLVQMMNRKYEDRLSELEKKIEKIESNVKE